MTRLQRQKKITRSEFKKEPCKEINRNIKTITWMVLAPWIDFPLPNHVLGTGSCKTHLLKLKWRNSTATWGPTFTGQRDAGNVQDKDLVERQGKIWSLYFKHMLDDNQTKTKKKKTPLTNIKGSLYHTRMCCKPGRIKHKVKSKASKVPRLKLWNWLMPEWQTVFLKHSID